MANFKINGIIDLKDVESIDPLQNFRVAIKRNCHIIQSVIVEPSEKQSMVEWSMKFDPGVDKPVGVTVVVGPDVPDERLRATDHYSVRVPANAFDDKQARVELAVPDHLYQRWLGFCKTYTIRGRVVCRKLRWDSIEQQLVPCESPVRGALVTAYDVDRLWWWCRSDSVGSDFTDLNGNFEITFKWCCWWWGPWYSRGWRLDPAIVRRIEEVFKVASPVIPLPPPTPELDLGIFETIASEMDAAQIVSPMAEAPFSSSRRFTDVGRQIAARLPAAPDLRELRIWPWWPHFDCKPDINFKVTQDCGEGTVTIYEDDCSDVRWNIPTEFSGVTLVANENACCAPCCTQQPDDDCLEFQGVGCDSYPITQIEQDMASNLVGYGLPGTQDRPFGRTMRILGVFGNDSTADFYKLQSRRYQPATDTWTTWLDIPPDQLVKFNRLHWRETPPPLTLTQAVEPDIVDGEWVLKTTRRFREEHVDIDVDVDPFRDDWLAQWATARIVTVAGDTIETPLISDGLYELRVIGYDYNAATDTLFNDRVMPVCSSSGDPLDPAAHAMMRLRLDNRSAISTPGTVHVNTLEPESDYPNICAVVKNEGMPDEECVSACGLLSVVSGDTITVHFQASDQDGHLERYTLNAHWAESDMFSLLSVSYPEAETVPNDNLVGPTYATTFLSGQGLHRSLLPLSNPEHDRPFWNGGHFKITVVVGDPVPSTSHHVFETCCAFLLRLRVWKRTTNGCTSSMYFHSNWSEFSFTIIRADLPCAETVLSEASADD